MWTRWPTSLLIRVTAQRRNVTNGFFHASPSTQTECLCHFFRHQWWSWWRTRNTFSLMPFLSIITNLDTLKKKITKRDNYKVSSSIIKSFLIYLIVEEFSKKSICLIKCALNIKFSQNNSEIRKGIHFQY